MDPQNKNLSAPGVLADDGLPIDPVIRSIIGKLKGKLSLDRNSYKAPETILAKLCKDAALEARCNEALARMAANGAIRQQWGSWEFSTAGRDNADTKEARLSNFHAITMNTAKRAALSEEAVDRYAEFFRQARQVYGPRKIDLGGYAGVVIPIGMAFENNRIVCSKAITVSFSRRGVEIGEVGRPGIETRWTEGAASFAVDAKTILACDKDLEADLHKSMWSSPVSVFFRTNCEFSRTLDKEMKRSLRSLYPFREAVSAFVGEDIDKSRWRSFMSSLCNVGMKRPMIRSFLFSVMDKEVRRAAMRNPEATYELYHWLAGDDELSRSRRLQASASFPVLTKMLPVFERVIDDGHELIPVIAQHLKLSKAVARALSGLHWQKLGREFRILTNIQPGDQTTIMIGDMPPDLLPKNKDEWVVVSRAAASFGRLTTRPIGRELTHLVTKYDRFRNLMDEGLFDALVDVARSLTRTGMGSWDIGDLADGFEVEESGRSASGHAMFPYANLLIEMLAAGGGAKRLSKFGKLWHRQINQIRPALEKVERSVLGEFQMVWSPLIEGDYQHGLGTIRFLHTQDQLAEEGVKMKHCVASYSYDCLSGRSHICHIESTSGDHSTAELNYQRNTIFSVQHQAYDNTPPHKENEKILADFLADANTRQLVDQKILRERTEAAQAEYRKVVVEATKMTDEDCDFIMATYAHLLAKFGLPTTTEAWREMASQYQPIAIEA